SKHLTLIFAVAERTNSCSAISWLSAARPPYGRGSFSKAARSAARAASLAWRRDLPSGSSSLFFFFLDMPYTIQCRFILLSFEWCAALLRCAWWPQLRHHLPYPLRYCQVFAT